MEERFFLTPCRWREVLQGFPPFDGATLSRSVIEMPRGGARNRSGPKADPDSARSDARSYSLQFLPTAGYAGETPDFPLPNASDRELVLWSEAWRTPQACAWSMPAQSWRQRTVAMWVRVSVRCEDPESGAAILAQLHRFADQIGMTTAGLAEMGWTIADNPDATSPEPSEEASSEPPKRRLAVV